MPSSNTTSAPDAEALTGFAGFSGIVLSNERKNNFDY